MELMMDLPQAHGLDMGIDFRGRHIGMAKKNLHRAQIRSSFQKVGGKGMPESVGGNRPADAGFKRVFFYNLPDILPGQAVAAAVEKEFFAGWLEEGTKFCNVFRKQFLGNGMQGHNALFRALADYPHKALLQIEI